MRLLLLSICLWLTCTWTQASAAPRYFPLDVDIILGEVTLGQVPAQISLEQEVLLQTEAFLALLRPQLVPSLWQSWQKALQNQDFFTVEALNALQADALYDPSLLAVIIVVDTALLAAKTISLDRQRDDGLQALPPAFFSSGHNVRMAQRYDHEASAGQPSRQPFTSEVDGFVRIGRENPLYYQHIYSFTEGERLTRRQSTLFYDDVEAANRFSMGDVTPRTLGFQVPLSVGGVSIERQYDVIQPFRRSFAGGRTDLVLDERSRVTVEVNGFERRILVLDAGRYDVRDVQLSDGENRVRLIVENAAGERQVLEYDFFSDTRLLSEGLVDYSISFGQQRQSTVDGIEYDGAVQINGFTLFGATPSYTLGVYGQYQVGGGVVGMVQRWASSIGFFALDAAQDTKHGVGAYALEGSYAYVDDAPRSWVNGQRVDIVARKKGRTFAPLEDIALADNLLEIDVGYQASLTDTLTLSLSARYQDRPQPATNRQQYNLGISNFWLPVLLTSSLSMTREQRQPNAYALLLSASVPLGTRDRMRVAVGSRDNEYRVDYLRTESSGIDTYGIDVGLVRAKTQEGGVGRLRYTGNRFSGEVDYTYIERPDGTLTQQSSLRGQVGIAYADGAVGIGRSVMPNFVVVSTHESLKDADVVAYRNRFDSNPAAYSDALGALVLPIFSTYTNESYDVLLENAPSFYNAADDGRLTLAPAAYGGYAVRLGNDANITVLGRLVDAEGQGIAYASGTLQPISGGGQSYRVFSNATGRFASEALPAGEYRLFIPNKTVQEVLIIPKSAEFMYTIGTIQVE